MLSSIIHWKLMSIGLLILLYSNIQGQIDEPCKKVILHVVDKKGVETNELDSISGGCGRPCNQASYVVLVDKRFLGKIKTYYDDCSGRWIKIEYYFLGIRTRIRKKDEINQ